MNRRKLPHHFLFPRAYFRARARGLPPVPVYFFHQIDPDGFSALCQRINTAGLRTLTFSELLNQPGRLTDSVVITLDDGWSSAWSLALPIAKRNSVRLTLFATPQTYEDTEERRSQLGGGVPASDLVERDRSERPLLTWGELRGLHQSGVVEIQSHSLNHAVVFTSNEARSVAGTQAESWQTGNIPLLRRVGDRDVPDFRLRRGELLAEVGPALVAENRFIPDGMPQANRLGSETDMAPRIDGQQVIPGRWESADERDRRIYDDLSQSRELLRRRLDGCDANILAPPWARMHRRVPRLAREAGYEALALGYPFGSGDADYDLPVTPRLYGEGLWTLVDGPILGVPRWLRTRRANLARRAAGAVP